MTVRHLKECLSVMKEKYLRNRGVMSLFRFAIVRHKGRRFVRAEFAAIDKDQRFVDGDPYFTFLFLDIKSGAIYSPLPSRKKNKPGEKSRYSVRSKDSTEELKKAIDPFSFFLR